MRFTLLTGGTPGNDLNLSLDRVASNRNFGNKIWNTARFITRNISKVKAEDAPAEPAYTAADRWILGRLSETIATVDRLMDGYQYGEAGRQAYDFLWGDYADWYLELSKVQMNKGGATAWTTLSVLLEVLDKTLRLLHPYIPYVTEATWQELRKAFMEADLGIGPAEGWAEALIIADWPKPTEIDLAAAAEFEQLRELVRRIRNIRAEQGVEPAKRIPAILAAGEQTPFLQEQADALAFLARLDSDQLTIAETAEPAPQAITLALGPITCYLPLAGMVDLGAERGRLETDADNLKQEINRLTGLLNSPFAEKAPEAVVQKERDKLSKLEASYAEVTGRLKSLA
ncbi:MAG: class I tRNA ligase family protein [Chloroflexota bacterium]